jgi:hypothetical protein
MQSGFRRKTEGGNTSGKLEQAIIKCKNRNCGTKVV